MNDVDMKNRVIEFGIPPIKELKNKTLQFVFEDQNLKGTLERGYHCLVNDVKLCLYEFENNLPIFSMDFFAGNPLISSFRKEEHYIWLELLYVHEASLRNKGIASFYIKKLQQYAYENSFKFIKVHPKSNAKNFKGNKGLSDAELIKFYNKLSTKEMPIEIV